MTSLFTSPTGILALVITGALFVLLIRFMARKRPRREVWFLRQRDRRGERLKITSETDRSIICGRSNPVHRFIKIGPSYEFNEGGTTVTRFFGMEGKAYTAKAKGKKWDGSISDYLKDLWGASFYNKIPSKQMKQLEDDKFAITIEPDVDVDKDLPHLTSDDVHDENDAVFLKNLAEGQKQSGKREFYQLLIGIGVGFGILLFLMRLGWV